MPPRKPYPTLNGTHKVKPEPLSVIDQLLFDLGVTAGKWRETKSDRYVKLYRKIYQQLRDLEWAGSLDLDALLPAEYMPADYLERFNVPAETKKLSKPSKPRRSTPVRQVIPQATKHQGR